jgi:hypothetical protein
MDQERVQEYLEKFDILHKRSKLIESFFGLKLEKPRQEGSGNWEKNINQSKCPYSVSLFKKKCAKIRSRLKLQFHKKIKSCF